MPQQQPPNSTIPRRKPASLFRAGILAVATLSFAVLGVDRPAVHAAGNSAATLPLDSSLFFVLDETISSRSKAGTVVRAHLKNAIVLDGVVAAQAGAPVEIEITQTSSAKSGNIDGSAEIYFKPFTLADGKILPLITPTSHLDPHMSAGQASTQGVTDTVGDIFIPYHIFYHIFRKGSDITLKPGTLIRARTAAIVAVSRGVIAVTTPAPFTTLIEKPHPAFVPAPLATPPGYLPPTPKPSPTVKPTTEPTKTP